MNNENISINSKKFNTNQEKDPVIFTIWPDYRITTGNVLYRDMNTACCMDIQILYETMQQISSEMMKRAGRKVQFEVIIKN